MAKSVQKKRSQDEGHGFAKKANQVTTAKRILEFLDKYLRTKPQAAS